MKCTVCGNEFDDGMAMCPKCGTRKIEMGVRKDKEENSAEEKKGIDYGYGTQKMDINQLVIKERKASALAGVDTKKMAIIALAVIVIGILLTMTIVDNVLKKTVDAGKYTVTIPASMKNLNDSFYELVRPESKAAFSNSKLELFCYEFDVYKLFPGAQKQPDPSDFEAYAEYLEERDKAESADREILKELSEQMSYDVKDFEQVSFVLNNLEFTYRDDSFGSNYVKVMTKLNGDRVYMFVCLCSENDAQRLEKDIDKILGSVKEK